MDKSSDMSHWQMFESTIFFAGWGGVQVFENAEFLGCFFFGGGGI